MTLLAILSLVGIGIYIFTQKTVDVDVDGETYAVRTHRGTVRELLGELQVTLAPEDSLTPGYEALLQSGLTIHIRRARRVLVEADGDLIELHSAQRSPAALLAAASVTLREGDRLYVDGALVETPALVPNGPPPVYLRVARAHRILVDDGGTEYTFSTTERTVGGVLEAMGLVIYLADTITPAVDTPLNDDLTITIARSSLLTVEVDGTTVQTRAQAATVAEALAETGIPLVGEDYSLPPPEAPLPENGVIQVVRVSYEVEVERSPVPYETVYRPDAAMELDTRRVVQMGAPGVAERRTRIRYENGVEVSRVTEPERVTQPPQDEIMAYGTRIVVRTLETPDGPLEYWRVIRMLATSYSPSNAGRPGDGPDAVSGTGLPVERGIVAVDPAVIPYFTQVYVPGYGTGLAADSGGAINGRRIDLGYSDADLVLWYSWVDVYLLTPIPNPEDILYVLP